MVSDKDRKQQNSIISALFSIGMDIKYHFGTLVVAQQSALPDTAGVHSISIGAACYGALGHVPSSTSNVLCHLRAAQTLTFNFMWLPIQ